MLRHVYMPTQHVNTSDVMPALIEEGGWLQREARQVPCTLTLSTPGRVVSCPRVQAGHTAGSPPQTPRISRWRPQRHFEGLNPAPKR